jgi:hypothetical protein
MARGLRESDFGPGRISYFARSAFGPHWKQVKAELAVKVDQFVRTAGVPAKIDSTFRTKQENAAAGGASSSRHLTGEAADLWLTDSAFFAHVPRYLKIAAAVGLRGVGIYAGKPLLHLDIRQEPASWAKLASGKMVDLASGLRAFLASKGGKAAGGLALLVGGLLLLLVLKGRRPDGT